MPQDPRHGELGHRGSRPNDDAYPNDGNADQSPDTGDWDGNGSRRRRRASEEGTSGTHVIDLLSKHGKAPQESTGSTRRRAEPGQYASNPDTSAAPPAPPAGPNGAGPNGAGPNGAGPNGAGPNTPQASGVDARARATSSRPAQQPVQPPVTPQQNGRAAAPNQTPPADASPNAAPRNGQSPQNFAGPAGPGATPPPAPGAPNPAQQRNGQRPGPPSGSGAVQSGAAQSGAAQPPPNHTTTPPPAPPRNGRAAPERPAEVSGPNGSVEHTQTNQPPASWSAPSQPQQDPPEGPRQVPQNRTGAHPAAGQQFNAPNAGQPSNGQTAGGPGAWTPPQAPNARPANAPQSGPQPVQRPDQPTAAQAPGQVNGSAHPQPQPVAGQPPAGAAPRPQAQQAQQGERSEQTQQVTPVVRPAPNSPAPNSPAPNSPGSDDAAATRITQALSSPPTAPESTPGRNGAEPNGTRVNGSGATSSGVNGQRTGSPDSRQAAAAPLTTQRPPITPHRANQRPPADAEVTAQQSPLPVANGPDAERTSLTEAVDPYAADAAAEDCPLADSAEYYFDEDFDEADLDEEDEDADGERDVQEIDATLARFSAVHDEIAREEEERRSKLKWLKRNHSEPELGKDMPFDFVQNNAGTSRVERKKQLRKRRTHVMVGGGVVAAIIVLSLIGVMVLG